MNIVFAVMLMLALLIGLVTAGGPATAAAQIPPELRTVANTWAFLASMGRRCETRLQWQGYAGVHEDVCRDFERQYDRVTTEFLGAQDVFDTARSAADAARSYAARVEWDLFLHEFQRSTQQVFKAMDHIIFLRESEAEKRKKPESRKKK